ncbi:MAG: hypothetical protein ACOCWC_04655, partial [Bacteroidota bacterium]
MNNFRNFKRIYLVVLFFIAAGNVAISGPGGNSLWISPCESGIFRSPDFSSPGGDQLTVTLWVKWTEQDMQAVGNNAIIATLSDSETDPNIGVFWMQHN